VGDFTVEEFEALCEKYGYACLRCGDGEALLTPDHVVPLSLKGSNLPENIQPLCVNCNSWKNIKVIDYRPDAILFRLTWTSRECLGRPGARENTKIL
jgi:5-methylcytosine-specific restriction endonuclease McrA